MRIVKENKWLLSLFAFVLMVVTCFTLTSSVVNVSANNTKGGNDGSFATISQAATLYLNVMSASGYEGCDELKQLDKAGNAGGMIGFMDSNAHDKQYILCARDTANVVVWSYASLSNNKYGANSTTKNHFIGYGLYGYALGELGLDEVGVGADSGSYRMLIGIVMMALYVLAVGMSTFFNLVIAILQFANPFRMFSNASNLNNWISDYSGNDAYGLGSALSAIGTQVSKLYDLAHDISLFLLIPLFLALAVFMWLVVNKGHNFGKIFKPFFVRVFFIVLGVPLMFGVYGVILDAIQGSVSASGSPATTVVGSLFCDFNAWVEGPENLTLPAKYRGTGGIHVDSVSMDVDSVSMANVRNICYAINKNSYGNNIFSETLSDMSNGLESYQNYDTMITADTNKPKYVLGTTVPTAVAQDADAIGVTLSILQKYARGDKVSAAKYESSAKATILADSKASQILFETSSNWTDYDDKQCAPASHDANSGAGGGTNGRNSAANFSLTAEEVAVIANERWRTGGAEKYGTADIFGNGGLTANVPGLLEQLFFKRLGSDVTFNISGNQALSTLALYNYLNTKFTSTEIRVSSPNSTSNDQVKYQHYAVTMVGNSFMKFIYLLDAAILMACISIIGYGYGFAMLVGNLKALFKMIPNVLTGMLGSIRGIASSFALMFAMVCEVVGTILLFDIAVDIMFGMYRIVEIPLAKALQSNGSGLSNLTSSLGGNVATALLGVVSCAVILFITKQLLAWRTAIVGATTAACTNFVNKLLDTSVSTPNIDGGSSNLLTKAGTAALAGVSLAHGASNGMFGEDAKNKMDDIRSSLTSSDTQNGIKSSLLNNDFGAKSGNGTGETVGSSETDSNVAGVNGELSSEDAQIAEETRKKAKADSERAGAGLVNDDTTSEAYAKAHEQDFEAALSGDEVESDDNTSSLVGDDNTSKQYGQWIDRTDESGKPTTDGTTTKTLADGSTQTTTRQTNDDGTVTTVTKTNNPNDGTVSTSKLVEAGNMQYTTTDTYGPDGEETHETQTVDKRNGNKVVTQEINTEAGKTLVEQMSHMTDSGDMETVTKTVNPDGTISQETAVTDSDTGDVTTTRETQAKGGSVYVKETVHKDTSTGNVVTTTTTSGAGSGLRGGREVVKQTTDANGEVIHEESTTYSSANTEIKKDETNVVRTDNVVTETRTTVSGGVTNKVTTVTNDSAGTQTKTYVSTGNTGTSVKKVENYSKQEDGSYVIQQNVQKTVTPTHVSSGVARPQTNVIHTTTVQPVNTVVENTIVQNQNTVTHNNMFDSNNGADQVYTSAAPSSSAQGSAPPAGRAIANKFK